MCTLLDGCGPGRRGGVGRGLWARSVGLGCRCLGSRGRGERCRGWGGSRLDVVVGRGSVGVGVVVKSADSLSRLSGRWSGSPRGGRVGLCYLSLRRSWSICTSGWAGLEGYRVVVGVRRQDTVGWGGGVGRCSRVVDCVSSLVSGRPTGRRGAGIGGFLVVANSWGWLMGWVYPRPRIVLIRCVSGGDCVVWPHECRMALGGRRLRLARVCGFDRGLVGGGVGDSSVGRQ